MKLTFDQANGILQNMQRTRLPNGQAIKSDLLNVRGDAALNVWRIRTGLRNAFEAEFGRLQDLREENQELSEKEKLTKKDKERQKQIREEIEKLAEEEKDVDIPTLKAEDIKGTITAEVLFDIEPIVEFEEADE